VPPLRESDYHAAMFARRSSLLAAVLLAGCGTTPVLVEVLDGSTSVTPSGVDAGTGAGVDAGAAVSPPDAGPLRGPPYPIVLLHGMAGFDQLKNLPIDITYFNGIIDDLAAHGEVEVFATLAPPYDSSEARAAAIAVQLDAIFAQTHAAKLNLIGHSQGGLDARILASPHGLGYGDRIASVTTIATPHRGTPLSDAALGLLKALPESDVDALTSALLKLMQLSLYDVQTDPDLRVQLVELSEDHARNVFNPKYVDDPRVKYSSYGGRTNLQSGLFDCDAKYQNDASRLDLVSPLFSPTAPLLAGPLNHSNDGLVTVDSARWGTFLQCVPADHLKQVGVLSPSQLETFDHRGFFRTVVARIRAAGF
jgi:triacylglycerol lipase